MVLNIELEHSKYIRTCYKTHRKETNQDLEEKKHININTVICDYKQKIGPMTVEETPAPNGLKMARKKATTRTPRQRTVLRNTRPEQHLIPGDPQDPPSSYPRARKEGEHKVTEEKVKGLPNRKTERPGQILENSREPPRQ